MGLKIYLAILKYALCCVLSALLKKEDIFALGCIATVFSLWG